MRCLHGQMIGTISPTSTTSTVATTTTRNQNGNSNHEIIYLTIIDLSDACSRNVVEETLRGLLKNYRSVHEAGKSTKNASYSPTSDDVVRSVMKYRKVEDRYCALCSLLLKSMAYHETMQEVSEMTRFLYDNPWWKEKLTSFFCCYCCYSEVRLSTIEDTTYKENYHTMTSTPVQPCPIISLPVTDYGKPYIPEPDPIQDFRRSRIWSRRQPLWNKHILSISHQFPFVASARLQLNSYPPVKGQSPTRSYYRQNRRQLVKVSTATTAVGLDIAVWNPATASSASEVDALKYFRTSFSDMEWNGICSSPSIHSQMKEFQIRWSMKEAYTKSLGLGMALNFGSFEMLPIIDGCQLDPCINTLEDTITIGKFSWLHNLWPTPNTTHGILSKHLCYRKVGVRHIAPNLRWDGRHLRNQTEFWDFWFLPLGGYPKGAEDREDKRVPEASPLLPFSVACICKGDSNLDLSACRNQNIIQTTIQVRNMPFTDLVCWHSRQRA